MSPQPDSGTREGMTIAKMYSAMGPQDKAALRAIKTEEEARTGRTLQLKDIIHATTPGLPDPEYLMHPLVRQGA